VTLFAPESPRRWCAVEVRESTKFDEATVAVKGQTTGRKFVSPRADYGRFYQNVYGCSGQRIFWACDDDVQMQ
jgi:hypothetical protein